jgi:hypothetical protein
VNSHRRSRSWEGGDPKARSCTQIVSNHEVDSGAVKIIEELRVGSVEFAKASRHYSLQGVWMVATKNELDRGQGYLKTHRDGKGSLVILVLVSHCFSRAYSFLLFLGTTGRFERRPDDNLPRHRQVPGAPPSLERDIDEAGLTDQCLRKYQQLCGFVLMVLLSATKQACTTVVCPTCCPQEDHHRNRRVGRHGMV